MTQVEAQSLERTIKNRENALEQSNMSTLELFNIDESSRVTESRYLYIPLKILNQHFQKEINYKIAEKKMRNEFVFLYTQEGWAREVILIPKNNYKKIKRANKQGAIDEETKKHILSFENKKYITLELLGTNYIMRNVPEEFRRRHDPITFGAENEPYIRMQSFRNWTI